MNKRNFHNAEPSNHQSENTWYTPKHIINTLGEFDLDPCSNSTRPFNTAKNHIEYDLGNCGYSIKWKGRVWLNPPYGKETYKWLNKLHQHGNGIALVFARCETKWAQDHFNKSDAFLFLDKRISFINKNGIKKGTAACGSVLFAYGKNNIESLKKCNGFLVYKQCKLL